MEMKKLNDAEKAVLHPYITEMMIDFGIQENRTDDFLMSMHRIDLEQGTLYFDPIIQYWTDTLTVPFWLKLQDPEIQSALYHQLNIRLRHGMRAYWTHRLLTVYNQKFPEITTVVPTPPTQEQLRKVQKYLGKPIESVNVIFM